MMVKVLAGLFLASCVTTHGYVRVAPHTDEGYHAQALVLVPAGPLEFEQLIDWQSIGPAFDGYISETHLLYPFDDHWKVFVYYRADSFVEDEWERRAGGGVQFSW